jgi:murein L,D-transpeptidase YcbB/YkuD
MQSLTIILGVIAQLVVLSPPAIGSTAFEDEVRKRGSILKESGTLAAGGQTFYGAGLTLQMLEVNDYKPIWNDMNTQAFLSAIGDLDTDGLNPEEYRFAEIGDLLKTKNSVALSTPARVDLDFLLSEAYLRAIYNLAFGKVDALSLDPNINFTRPISNENPAPELLQYVTKANFAGAFKLARPQSPRYGEMKKALAAYRAIQAAGGWPAIESGPTLKPGHTDARITELRRRLQATGDQPNAEGSENNPGVFDDDLVEAVKRFQKRHGLEADGVVGPATLAALNVPVEVRIDQIRLNLERQRWILHEAVGEFLVADIAGFNLYWVRAKQIIWEAKIQVGQNYTQTPLFKSTVDRIVFNPDWTIPPGILNRTVIPNLKKDPGYLDQKGYWLLTLDGRRVDPKTIDWKSRKGFPYIVRQPPGPDNALGQVKFMFPNPHHVFLHDTNHRELFDRTSRTFSAGCIRLQDPFDLAQRLLDGQDDWDRERIDRTIASGKTVTVNLKKPLRIVIAYATAAIMDGRVTFRPDVYKRDAAVLRALDGPFTLRKQDL